MVKALDLWLPSYLMGAPHPGGVTDIVFCICDHFEPLHNTDYDGAVERLRHWQQQYPKLIDRFRGSAGVGPRHTFFYPIEQYNGGLVEELGKLCELCGGEVEIHLHHDGDTGASLADKLECGKSQLASHGMLGRDADARIRYGFVHGNWALANSDPEGKNCGVNTELSILKDTGCFADFTMPSAPHRTQTRIINSLYYAKETHRPKSHDRGERVRCAAIFDSALREGLLCVQGPLCLNWKTRKLGVFPKIENGDLTGPNPPTSLRLTHWIKTGVHVEGRPEWIFIKLHTHGAYPGNMPALLGKPMEDFLHALTAPNGPTKGMNVHFATARELVNILHAAEDACEGSPSDYRNYRYGPPPLAA